MTIHLVTFSDESMSRSRRLCCTSAREHGVDQVIECEATECPPERGLGFWKWKPAVISTAFDNDDPRVNLLDGDILIYSDAGVEFIDNVNYIIDRMDQDIFLFGNNWEHAHWCKRDVVEEIWGITVVEHRNAGLDWDDEEGFSKLNWSRFGKQAQASVIFFRVSDYSCRFVREWLDWCLFEGGRLVDDSPSRIPNHPQFQENRHDQSILTTLAYREGLRLHYWPAMYNDGAFTYEKLPEYAGDDYPTLFHHHRRRNHEWEAVA